MNIPLFRCFGILGAVQLLLSVFSLVFRWDEKYLYALESSRENNALYNKFKDLAVAPFQDIEHKYQALLDENDGRELKDLGQAVTEIEKKFGYKSALKQFGLACHECAKSKTCWKPFGCETCGRHLIKGKKNETSSC